MRTPIHMFILILEISVFTFQRADVACRPDYVEEDSVF